MLNHTLNTTSLPHQSVEEVQTLAGFDPEQPKTKQDYNNTSEEEGTGKQKSNGENDHMPKPCQEKVRDRNPYLLIQQINQKNYAELNTEFYIKGHPGILQLVWYIRNKRGLNRLLSYPMVYAENHKFPEFRNESYNIQVELFGKFKERKFRYLT